MRRRSNDLRPADVVAIIWLIAVVCIIILGVFSVVSASKKTCEPGYVKITNRGVNPVCVQGYIP